MKKIISVLMLAAMLICFSATAFAVSEDCVMTVDGTEYTDFEEGWNAGLAATANNENVVNVVLYADWYPDENGSFGSGKGFEKGAIYISDDTRDMCLDLNGHTIDRKLFSWESPDSKADSALETFSGEVIHIDDGSENITIKNGTIRGANNLNNGGVYIDDAEVLFENMTFASNKADKGGALYNNGGKVVLESCRFELNYAQEAGGAVYNNGDITVNNCVFENNKADCKFEDELGGGALYNNDKAKITSCEFIGNYAVRFGGAVYNDNDDLVIESCTFEQNEAKDGGAGALYTDFEMTVKNSTFTGNKGSYIGACYVDDTVHFENCTFTENTSNHNNTCQASVFYVDTSAELYLKDCTIEKNTGSSAVFINTIIFDEGEMWLDGKVIINNNKNSAGDELNVCCWEEGAMATSIYLKEGFSEDSFIGVGMGDTDLKDEEAVEDIPGRWTKEMLEKCFKMDKIFIDGTANNDYYLAKGDGSIDFKKGDPANDSNALGTQNETGSLFGEGSVTMIAVFTVVVTVAGAVVIIRNRKMKAE